MDEDSERERSLALYNRAELLELINKLEARVAFLEAAQSLGWMMWETEQQKNDTAKIRPKTENEDASPKRRPNEGR